MTCITYNGTYIQVGLTQPIAWGFILDCYTSCFTLNALFFTSVPAYPNQDRNVKGKDKSPYPEVPVDFLHTGGIS